MLDFETVMEPDPTAEGTIPILTPLRHLPMRVRLAVALTDEALFEFCRINHDLRIERTPDGELIIMSPTGAETGRRNFRLTTRFGVWVERDGTGVGFDSSTGFLLPNGAERSPDVAWVRAARWQALTPAQREKFAPLCPDFVVELRSPSDSLPDLEAKMTEYLENGASLGWLIDPITHRVHVFRAGAEVQVLDQPASVSGEPLLRGFVLDLDGIG